MSYILQADMHTHTLASTHAYSTIRENCLYAAEYGLKAIAMTDHMVNMPDAPHIWHFENLKALPRKINGVYVIKGAEVNITDQDGALDIEQLLSQKLEWIVASMHKWTMSAGDYYSYTKAYLAVAKNPFIDVIGHCTTAAFPFDMEKCLKAFKEYDKLVEINESSILNKKGSRQNSIEVLKICKKYDIPIVVDSDCHYCEAIGQTPAAFQLLEDNDFPERLVYNCRWDIIRDRIMKKHTNCEL